MNRTGTDMTRWRRWIPRKLLSVLAVGCGVCTLGSPALARTLPKLTYNVTFSISHGLYFSDSNLGDGLSVNETDDFAPVTLYQSLRIPRRGPASSTIHLKGINFPVESSWEDFGVGYTDPQGDTAPFDCKGHLTADESTPPVLLSGAGSANTTLNLYIQSVSEYRVAGSSGNDQSVEGGCPFFDGDYAFEPAVVQYMPDMLTVHVQVALAQLRKLKKGDAIKLKVSDSDAEATPPSNCIPDCTQHLHWKGTVSFRRTG